MRFTLASAESRLYRMAWMVTKPNVFRRVISTKSLIFVRPMTRIWCQVEATGS